MNKMILAKGSKIEGYRLFWEQITFPASCGHEIRLHKSKSTAQTNADLKNNFEQTLSAKTRLHYWIEPVYLGLEEI